MGTRDSIIAFLGILTVVQAGDLNVWRIGNPVRTPQEAAAACGFGARLANLEEVHKHRGCGCGCGWIKEGYGINPGCQDSNNKGPTICPPDPSAANTPKGYQPFCTGKKPGGGIKMPPFGGTAGGGLKTPETAGGGLKPSGTAGGGLKKPGTAGGALRTPTATAGGGLRTPSGTAGGGLRTPSGTAGGGLRPTNRHKNLNMNTNFNFGR